MKISNSIKFSIIVPVYNGEAYIEECLNSLVKQQYENYEVIVVDDGSTDSSGQICDAFAERYDFIKVIHQKNKGLVASRATGVRMAEGNYILNVDADDYVSESWLSDIENVLTDTSADVVAYDNLNIDNDGHIIFKSNNNSDAGFYSGKDYESLVKKFLYDPSKKGFNTGSLTYTIWSKVVKRDIYVRCLEEIDSRIKKGEDLIALLYIFEKAKNILVTDQCNYFHRVYRNSMMGHFEMEDIEKQVLLANLLNLYSQTGYVSGEQINVYIHFSTFELIRVAISQGIKLNKYMRIIKQPVVVELLCINFPIYPTLSVREKIRVSITRKHMWFLLYVYIRLSMKGRKSDYK